MKSIVNFLFCFFFISDKEPYHGCTDIKLLLKKEIKKMDLTNADIDIQNSEAAISLTFYMYIYEV